MKELVWVAAGGAIGAVARYLVSLGLSRGGETAFPYATLLVNVVGSFALGALAGLMARGSLSNELRLFVGVGVLGALTTFSTFSVETWSLLRAGRIAGATFNVLGNVVLSLSAAALAAWWIQRGR